MPAQAETRRATEFKDEPSHAQNLDPKATQRVRLPSKPADPIVTQPVRPRKASDDSRTDPQAPPSPRPAWRQWAARHKGILILAGVLIVTTLLAILGVAIRNAQGVQHATVGSGAVQMRAASLAREDLSDRDLKWANLNQADLRQANLSNADMLGADLSGANLEEANLEAAILRGADMSGAQMSRAVFAGADLHWAVLRNADLSQADLTGADLQGADLENATLQGANLEGANLKNAHLLGTTLPDGSSWSPSSTLRRFTDPSHPDFWRPGDAQSVAYR
jgi:hypothetical protein